MRLVLIGPILALTIAPVNSVTPVNVTEINTKVEWTLENSPYVVHKDLYVLDRGELVISPGVEIQFESQVGITVRGILKAEGTQEKKIRFIPKEDIYPTQPNRTIRLVDGPTVNEGIIQILDQGWWRSVCTNSKNWTAIDMGVACKQLGFQGGEWYHWYPHLNQTRQILFEEPGCDGFEDRIEDCRFERRKFGSGVCDLHPNLGLRCLPFHHEHDKTSDGHWRGLRFESASFRKDLTSDNTLYVSNSKSRLVHVEIIGAGSGKYLGKSNTTSAIETWGVPPIMEFMLVTNSAYNGINITQPGGLVSIAYSNITYNRGYGIYVNSTKGTVSIFNTSVTKNFADGIKYFFHDLRPETKLIDGVDIHDFCTYSTTYSQTYPFLMVAEQYSDSVVNKSCGKRFYTSHGYVLTLHFVHFTAKTNDGVTLEIRDGSDASARLIKEIQVKNFTRPESVVTTGNNLFITFKAKAKIQSEVFLEVTAGPKKAYDINVTSSVIEDNSGRGIWLEWMRSAVHIHKSTIQHHNYVAGLHVSGGAGDVNVTHSVISNNYVDGINITYGGGHTNVSWSTISDNVGMGVALWINETTVNFPVKQEMTVSYSNISLNHDIGVLVGNYCGPAIVNISGNYFDDGRYIGLEILSCWRDTLLERVPEGITEIFIGHNFFRGHERVALKMSPLVRAQGKIVHNDFRGNKDGCLYIYNVDDFILEIQKAQMLIEENRFLENSGRFVLNLGLSHYDYKKIQNLNMQFNWVQQNRINEPWHNLNARSMVAAAIVIGSDNVQIHRNLIENPASRYEIGSHLVEPNTQIKCENNWLGFKEERLVWERVFDRDDRYNLAKINYVPYLLSNNINTELVLERPEWEHQFIDSENFEIGGEVTGVEELKRDGVYIVRRDINVRPNGRLKITPGVQLKFEHSVGMMVSGELITEGDLKGGKPVFTLHETMPVNGTVSKIRLVGGKSSREGRLQVQINDQWGTVCNHGWTIHSAALACQQMGWVLNPEDWDLKSDEIPSVGSEHPILLSNVRCDPLDTDVTSCKLSEGTDMMHNSCTHEDDVGLKCYGLSWSGVRLGMTAKRSKLFDVQIEKAGLYDFRLHEFKAALQVDFSHHVFEHIVVTDNDHDGLGVHYSDIYHPDKVNIIKNSRFINNKRHGVSFRQVGMVLNNCEILGNRGSGIHHDAMLDKLEQRELAEWMSLKREQDENLVIDIPSKTDKGTTSGDPIIIPEGESLLLETKTLNESTSKTYYIRAERDEFVLGMQLINPFHNYTSEVLLVYDFKEVSNEKWIEVWNVSRDIASFPTISSSYAITLKYESGSHALGGMMFLITPINCANLPGNCNTKAFYVNPLHRDRIVPGSFSRLTVQSSTVSGNGRGISTVHYNRFLGHDNQVYLRKSNESIEVFDSEISFSQREAIHVFTPFREIHPYNITEITFMINRTRFTDNHGGIYQYSKDLRDSNNLFHWVLRENTFERNGGGGIDITLPYVWQYNANYTHTVHVDSNYMVKNKNFGLTIRGHFARVYIVNNTIFDNFCHGGLLALRGMEKESWIFANNIQNNDGIYMAEFEMDSHSEILGFVEAYFTQNIIQRNRHSHEIYEHPYHPASYAVSIKGVQKFNITDNLFGNHQLDYELLAGVNTARVSNYLNVERNFWGTPKLELIRERIFDFDDWNSYAIASFLPYFLEDSFESSLSTSFDQNPPLDLDRLGGRLFESLHLIARPGRPYVIQSDLTVMPDATLVIEPGAELQFYPSVGILVLGTLHAQGRMEQNIVFKPVEPHIRDQQKQQHLQHSRTKRAPSTQRSNTSIESDEIDVRLCIADRNGTICPPNTDQGFLEIFNRTTHQWVPICDKRFAERNAQVICKQLGFDFLNVYLGFDQRIEYNALSLVRTIFWPEPFQCTGKENRLADCPLRMDGENQGYGREFQCDWQSKDFVFIHCGKPNLDPDYSYWGGIRFSVKEFEQELFHERIHDAVTHSTREKHQSTLEYVQIVGAGVLHGEKSPAVQVVMKSPLLSSLNITHCAHDGINLISPSKTMNMLYNKIENNMGIGLSAAVMTGEVRQEELSAFVPIEHIPIPYHNFGLVDICDPQKEIVVEERVLLYHKYDNYPVDCVKTFSSIYDVKPIGFRLLQYKLVNGTNEAWTPDNIELFDGDIYNISSAKIVELKVDGSTLDRSLYKTSRTNAMGIKFHSTGSRENLGFLAEIVTLPISVAGIDRDIRHNISFSVFENNQRGAVYYTSAGEINPIITMQRNRFAANCVSLYGNFSTCQSAIHLDIQNTQDVFFYNNFVNKNIGGLFIQAGSSGTATAMRGLLHNNVFEGNEKKSTLEITGRQTSPYQQATLFRNYFTRNNVTHEPVIKLLQVVCNVSHNTVHNNYGKSIMDVTGFNNVRLPIYQSFTHNGFYNNIAYGLHCEKTSLGHCRWGSRATIVAGSAGQEYVDNVFYNRNNDYELVTLNRSEYDVWKTPINAKYNYWAYNETYAVAGRIKDLHDEDGLLEVDFTPFQMNNKSLLSGKCQPGWTLLGDTCFMYLGGPMSYQQANEFCAKDNATLPTIRNFRQYYLLTHYLETQQDDWRYYDMVWINDLDNQLCNVFVDGSVKSVSCDFMLPTLCEMDEHVRLSAPTSVAELQKEVIYSMIAVGLMLLLIFVMCCLWCNKSKQRKQERFGRRNSIRLSKSSLGSRSLASMASTNFSDVNYRRRLYQQPNGGGANRIVTNSSYDTLAEKRSLALNSTADDDLRSYEVFEAHNATSTNPFGSHLSPNQSQQTFADMHTVHYSPSDGTASQSQYFQTNGTVRETPVPTYDNSAFRPDSSAGNHIQNSPWANMSNTWGTNSRMPDETPYTTSSFGTQPRQGAQERMPNNAGEHEDRNPFHGDMDSSRRASAANLLDPNPFDGPNTSTFDSNTNRSTFKVGDRDPHESAYSGNIPSVPGYAQPYAHLDRPSDPPPSPPSPEKKAVNPPPKPDRSHLLYTSLDEGMASRPTRSRSVDQILETNLDSDSSWDDPVPLENKSRTESNLLETDM